MPHTASLVKRAGQLNAIRNLESRAGNPKGRNMQSLWVSALEPGKMGPGMNLNWGPFGTHRLGRFVCPSFFYQQLLRGFPIEDHRQ